MSGRTYAVQFNAVAVSVLQDLFEVTAPSTTVVEILGWSLLQTTDVGDAQDEVIRVTTTRGVGSTSGSGGTTPTPQPIHDGDAAFAGTVEANNTTQMTAGGGSLEILEQYGWNVRIPWVHYYLPEMRPRIRPSQRWTLAFPAAPADAITMSATLWFRALA